MQIDVSDEQPENTSDPSVASFDGVSNTMSRRAEHPEKQFEESIVTDFGIQTQDKDLQSAKARLE
jgi:hypothetical protein